jgi:hypothetical protein
MHELELHAEATALQVTETLVVNNPTKTAYVGEAVNMPAPITLRLAIPPGFERVTFYDEFHGRRFQAIDGQAVTDIPWPPGRRTLKFTYRLPIEDRRKVFERKLDLPVSRLRVIVRGEEPGHVSCNLPRKTAIGEQGQAFESDGSSFPAGHLVRVEFGGLPMPWMTYAKWSSLGLLAALVLGTVWFGSRRARKPDGHAPDEAPDAAARRTKNAVEEPKRKRRARSRSKQRAA